MTVPGAAPRAPGAACPSPRALMLEQLTTGMRAAVETGDLEAARVAHEAIGRLLGLPSTPAPVIDLGDERRKPILLAVLVALGVASQKSAPAGWNLRGAMRTGEVHMANSVRGKG